ncbi:hypothetical protein [Pseudoroseomonas ludipueritiae]|uniref:Uncharacterized protein n=1 Tax=Pseudoroseomonas ludipueritiae TaxID=198093 RepID=A0ABR7RCK3_9PROT|nr:hypothetical protein [Pseudoroseomonas ludipueritiae]MBC9179572.1 hypothetical protein [Pseudoroseomonas ludipueritiae]
MSAPAHRPIAYQEKSRAYEQRRKEWQDRVWPKLAERLRQQAEKKEGKQ